MGKSLLKALISPMGVKVDSYLLQNSFIKIMKKNKVSFLMIVISLALIANGYLQIGVTMANTQALAAAKLQYKCYSSIHYSAGSSVISCDDCCLQENQTDDLLCFHDWCER